jgi:hypothetical protein
MPAAAKHLAEGANVCASWLQKQGLYLPTRLVTPMYELPRAARSPLAVRESLVPRQNR